MIEVFFGDKEVWHTGHDLIEHNNESVAAGQNISAPLQISLESKGKLLYVCMYLQILQPI